MIINLPSIYRLFDKLRASALRKKMEPLSFKDFSEFILGTDNLTKAGYVAGNTRIVRIDKNDGFHKFNIKWINK